MRPNKLPLWEASVFSWTVLALALLAQAAAAPAMQGERAEINDTARFIAGLAPLGRGELAQLAGTSEWTDYATSMDRRWKLFDSRRLQPTRAWRAAKMRDVRAETVFYPFSGPDFIYVETFFPRATTYILCGLEPVGTLPSLETVQPLTLTLGWVKGSLKTLLDAGYFVTKDMRLELKSGPLQGALPLLCVMLVRSGDRIVSLTSDRGHAEIQFVAPGDTRTRTLSYFCADLSDGALGKGSAFLDFIHQAQPDAAYIKAASYLMHGTGFSIIRNTLLTECSTIVQDDSGIPLRNFDLRRWHLHLYGTYETPLDIFKQYYQPDLAELYAKSPAMKIDFGVGYHWNLKSSNLLVATATQPRARAAPKKPAPAAGQAPARSPSQNRQPPDDDTEYLR